MAILSSRHTESECKGLRMNLERELFYSSTRNMNIISETNETYHFGHEVLHLDKPNTLTIIQVPRPLFLGRIADHNPVG
jgi:hypothetical protein